MANEPLLPFDSTDARLAEGKNAGSTGVTLARLHIETETDRMSHGTHSARAFIVSLPSYPGMTDE